MRTYFQAQGDGFGMHSVLVVDEDQALRRTVTSWIDSFGYAVQEVPTVEDALRSMDRDPSSIALCDACMAGKDGVWLAWQLRERHPQTAVIVATALRDCESAFSNLRNDVVDYLLKPFDQARLLEALSLACDWHAAVAGADDLHDALQDRLRTRLAVLATALAEAQTTHSAALDGLITMLQFHERDGRGHSRRVARLTLALADELGVGNDSTLLDLEHGALLHDIGKLDVPASILAKPAPLDDHEWDVMRRHPQVGYDLLKKLQRFSSAADIVLAHHEAFDGSGYPRGLQGNAIPIGARILAIADAYDSMTHPHTQRPPMPPSMALSEIERCCGSQFDPLVAEALGAVFADVAEEQVVH
jgi:putative nucleotidyltransferase with HDIG domain